jgi:hypothetical protein
MAAPESCDVAIITDMLFSNNQDNVMSTSPDILKILWRGPDTLVIPFK